MQKWEYKRLEINPSEEELNELGSQGWELVAANEYYCYFKRPLH